MNRNLWLALALVASGCYVEVHNDKGDTGDTGLPSDGAPPSCEITSPTDGQILGTGLPIQLEATASDPDGAAEDLVGAWSSSLAGDLGEANADADGNIVLETTALSAGSHVLTLVVTDASGARCTDEVSVEVQGAPAVRIELPGPYSVLPEGDVTFSAIVGDVEDPAESLVLSWTDESGNVLGSAPAATDGTVGITAPFESGEHTVTLSATDTTGLTGSASVTFTVDDAPSAPVVSIQPVAPGTLDDLTVQIDTASTDAEGSAITYTYEWSLNGVVSAASTTEVLPADATTRDDVWTVTVTPNDGVQNGPAGTAEITIGNTAPLAPFVAITPAAPTDADDLICTITKDATDPDGDAVSYNIVWDKDGVVYKGATSTTTLPGDTVPNASTGVGQGWTCSVTPTDGIDLGAVRTASAFVQ